MLVKTGTVELLIWSAAAYQAEYKAIEAMAPQDLPAIVGVTIAVERARPLQALLRANNVPFGLAEGDRVLTAPEQSGGLMISSFRRTRSCRRGPPGPLILFGPRRILRAHDS